MTVYPGDLEHPYISVVTPTLNQGCFIEETIQSVLSQRHVNLEHIVIDGGSTDETISILQKYSHLKWISEKDKGQSDALNKGLKKAQGEIVAWLNSDDYYPTEKILASVVRAFRSNPEIKVVVGDCLAIYEDSDRKDRLYNRGLEFEDMIRYWDARVPPHQPSVFFHKDLIREFGEFDVSLNRTMDYDFWLRISQKHRFVYIPEVLSVYRLHSSSKSGLGNDWSMFYSEWHQTYLRYKGLSKILPQKTLVSVALPLSQDGQNLTTVREAIQRLQNQRLRDMEILVVTDMDDASNLLQATSTPIPVRIIHLSHFTNAAFCDAIQQNAQGFALHCPFPETVVPDHWYAKALDILLDHPELKSVRDVSLNSTHSSNSTDPIRSEPFELWRTDSFRTFQYRLSVIIPTFNRADVICQSLDALQRQTMNSKEFEVIISDDGSSDETARLVQNYPATYSLTYLRQDNSGAAAARNAAIRRSKGKYLVILNDDAIPSENLLEMHLNSHESSKLEKLIVLGSFPFSEEFVDTPFMKLMERSNFAFQYAGMTSGSFYDWKYFLTCNISLPASALEESGLFDEDFRKYGSEDLELGYRLWKRGYKILYNSSCTADHAHRLSLKGFCLRQVLVGQSFILFAIKHPELLQSLTGFPSYFDARQTIVQWLSRSEKKAIHSMHSLEQIDSKSALNNPEILKQMEIEFQAVNKYWLYQGFLHGLDLRDRANYEQPVSVADKKSLRITFVVPGTAMSGGIKIIFEYCNRLAERGHQITLASLTAETPEWFAFDKRVHFITSGWSDRRLNYDLPDGDVVFATQWVTAYPVARLSSTKGLKFYFVQDYESITITTPELADPTYMLPLQKIVVSTRLGEQIKEHSGTTAEVIPNGMDLKQFFPDLSVRAQFPASDFRIGMLYHWESRKGFDKGQEAFRIVKAKYPEAKLILFGTSKPTEEVQFDEMNLNIAGDQVRSYYNSLDIFVSTSYQEGFGLPGLEALASGVSLVTTDSGGVREYALNEKTALVCPPGDSKAIADAMIRLRSDLLLKERLIKGGLEIARQFDWNRSVVKMEDWLMSKVKQIDDRFNTSMERSRSDHPHIAGKFYSKPSSAPFWLQLFWKLRDKTQAWRLHYGYLFTRRIR